MLNPCNDCKENSVVVKTYTTKKGKRSRVAFCINGGCGYRQELPFQNIEVCHETGKV